MMDVLLPPSGNGPGVVVAHPWWGLNATIRNYAAALAQQGFVVALPDVFNGKVASSIEDAQALADTAWSPDATSTYCDALAVLADHPAVTSRAMGMVAFSYGGYFALGLAGRSDLPLAGIVAYYATRDLTAPHVPVLAHLAQTEPFESNESLEALAERLARAGAPSAAHFYASTSHWFAEADRPEYEPAAADLAFARTVAFLREVTAD